MSVDNQSKTIRFQSLFSWNSPSDVDSRHGPARASLVSILVFVELALGPILDNPYCIHKPRFQSLFSWNSPSDQIFLLVCVYEPIVSILVFVELALGHTKNTATEIQRALFQSLFSWNSPSDRGNRLRPSVPELFQSLFSWNSPSDVVSRLYEDIDFFVSILVFVELALGP